MRTHDQEPVSTVRLQPQPTPAQSAGTAPSHPAEPLTPQAVLHLQRTLGNAVVAQSITTRQEAAGTEDQHAHGPGCGHEGVKGSDPAGQRSLLDAALASPSRSLPGSLRAEAEPFFHNDFSDVRLHDGPVAQRATAAMGAQAMTVGSHLFLPPGGARNRVLVGHELSHLDKNLKGERETGTDNGAGVAVTDPAQRSERTADTDGAAFATGVGTAPSVIAQRAAAVPTARSAQRSSPVQRAPGSSSDEYDDGGISEQDLARSSRKYFLAALYDEFVKSNQWNLSRTEGDDDFTATKRPRTQSRPRSFEDTPQVKDLRRVSMVVKTYLRNQNMNPVEVQAGIGGDGRLLIAANDAASNRHLQHRFSASEGAEVLADMMENTRKIVREKNFPAEKRNQHEIHATAGRQHTKVKPEPNSSLQLPAIQSAVSSGVAVAADGAPGLHAERRIKECNGGITPEHLGGSKRPCPSCAFKLYFEGNSEAHPEVHAGVFRSDDLSNIGFAEYDHNDLGNEKARAVSFFQKINKIEKTYVTVTKRGVEVPEIGTESESEAG